jgi:hypothetical protein
MDEDLLRDVIECLLEYGLDNNLRISDLSLWYSNPKIFTLEKITRNRNFEDLYPEH